MCGITGAYALTAKGKSSHALLGAAVNTLTQRGPDGNGTYVQGSVALGHSRLAVIDTSATANQPFTDASSRFTIVFNGEIYNYREIAEQLPKVTFRTSSDTEVLLHGFMEWGEKVLDKLNGFFAFAIYDKQTDELFLARDRMGIKPLLVYRSTDAVIFGSEMKALMAFNIPRELDADSEFLYHQFNYTPYPETIFKDVKEMRPGSWMRIRPGSITEGVYWKIPLPTSKRTGLSYGEAQKKLRELLDDSVRQRMIADVPLGSFLSGGIDSSVIATLASHHTDKLRTFSIGYADEPLFDETAYAQAVAERIGSEHTVFKLTNADLYEDLHKVLDYIDRPFADSSVLPVHILSRHTRKHVTVALSGDGADELFSGYNKHAAEYRARNAGLKEQLVVALRSLWAMLPATRNSRIGNTVRQLQKFSNGVAYGPRDRYWNWASFMLPADVLQLMKDGTVNLEAIEARKELLTKELGSTSDVDEVLYTDLHQVLRNDMLTKVDLMSMANSLEVRVPFLDHRIVEFACSLPESYKITGNMRKRILQETFRQDLPEMLFNRPKHGFEVPLQNWFRGELSGLIKDDLLSERLIAEQGIFDQHFINGLVNRSYSSNSGDAAMHIWNLIVFQTWWKKYIR